MEDKVTEKEIKCAVLGYGPAFNMGKYHCKLIREVKGLSLMSICDLNPERTAVAKKDFPEVTTYNSVDEMLKKADIDLVTIVTPHNTHASLAIQCLKAGKNVIVEKPMCITVKEATEMIETAEASGKMLSVFHQRRFDGDFLAIKEVIDKGLIGKVFHIETGGGGYAHPGYWWRSDKKISGGAFYDWGAHFVDWVLNLIPGKMVGITGFFHKLVWNDVTNEDHVGALIRFENGALADVQLSHIDRVGRARWRILGTKGAILDRGGERFKVNTEIEDIPAEMEIKYKKTDYKKYYQNIVKHLLSGEKLKVTPQSARRVIAVFETAEKSAKSGRTEPVPYE